MTLDERIAEFVALREAGTPGNWWPYRKYSVVAGAPGSGTVVCQSADGGAGAAAWASNRPIIIASVNLVPDLIAEVGRLRGALTSLKSAADHMLLAEWSNSLYEETPPTVIELWKRSAETVAILKASYEK